MPILMGDVVRLVDNDLPMPERSLGFSSYGYESF